VTNVEIVTLSNSATSVTTVDNLVASGANLYVNGLALLAANALVWNGAAETNGTFSIVGGAGSDNITGGSLADTITGGAGSDTITGGLGNDTLGLAAGDAAGSKVITANAGDDPIYGGAASDTVDGGDGADSIVGGAGSDQITGGLGADTMTGGAGVDAFVITAADTAIDTITDWNAGAAQDTISTNYTAAGTLKITIANNAGTAGTLNLGTVLGSAGAVASVIGGDGSDNITGGAGADTISGGAGADSIVGGAGSDQITAGTGVDTLTGGDGVDTFVTTVGAAYTTASADTITDFTVGSSGDILQVSIADSTAIDSLGVVTAGNGATAIAGNLVLKAVTKGAGATALSATDEALVLTGTYADSAALKADLASTGTTAISWSTAPTTTNGFVVVWNNGTNTYVSTISDAGADAAWTAADLAVTDIVVLTGVLTAFDTANLVAVS
jgi:Ca2+-binding RTX toxin-like protein